MKPAVKKKAGILPPDTLHRLHPVCFVLHTENKMSEDPVLLRTYIRSVVVYFTFCKINCYVHQVEGTRFRKQRVMHPDNLSVSKKLSVSQGRNHISGGE